MHFVLITIHQLDLPVGLGQLRKDTGDCSGGSFTVDHRRTLATVVAPLVVSCVSRVTVYVPAASDMGVQQATRALVEL